MSDFDETSVTKEELEKLTEAFKKDEFKKMFFDYCKEISSPESRLQYEKDIVQLESERGVDCIFLNPEPGFVVKTSVDGKTKAFINVAKCDKIDRPKSELKPENEGEKPKLSWNIPYAQSPPRKDLDNKNNKCIVYDVLFHPDALYLADKNSQFRKFLIDTACDGVERNFNVQLDRTNLKFPKLKFKGVPRPVVSRKLSQNPPSDFQEHSPLDDYMPPMPENKTEEMKIHQCKSKNPDEYTTPHYVIKHKKDIDLSEMTYELDAKLNVTIPKELIIVIDLPLLRTIGDCTLDVTDKVLDLRSHTPAKYKLHLSLPFSVDEENGSAKFDKSTKQLTVVLPVSKRNYQVNLHDLYRQDSGIDSGDSIKDDSILSESGDSLPSLNGFKEESYSRISEEDTTNEQQGGNNEDEELNDKKMKKEKPFLDETLKYYFPEFEFLQNKEENLNEIIFTLNVEKIEPDSMKSMTKEGFFHVVFSSLGTGCYPLHYSFYVEFPTNDDNKSAIIVKNDVQISDLNLSVTLELNSITSEHTSYFAGLNADETREYSIEKLTPRKYDQLFVSEVKSSSISNMKNDENSDISPSDKCSENELNSSLIQKDDKKCSPSNNNKKPRKKNKKCRSLSESSCEDYLNMSTDNVLECTDASKIEKHTRNFLLTRKTRSFSESRDSGIETSTLRGILKKRGSTSRSLSESYSSIDDHLSNSCDFNVFDEIPQEEDENHVNGTGADGLKKTVRFSDVIRKQLFRLDSSILGQRKKNQKRKSKKLRALQRRNSEGDSSDYVDTKDN